MLRVQFSRHARRRAKLYDISEQDIIAVIREKVIAQERMDIIVNLDECSHAIKVVVSRRGEEVTVITCYPLKKGIK